MRKLAFMIAAVALFAFVISTTQAVATIPEGNLALDFTYMHPRIDLAETCIATQTCNDIAVAISRLMDRPGCQVAITVQRDDHWAYDAVQKLVESAGTKHVANNEKSLFEAMTVAMSADSLNTAEKSAVAFTATRLDNTPARAWVGGTIS